MLDRPLKTSDSLVCPSVPSSRSMTITGADEALSATLMDVLIHKITRLVNLHHERV